MVGYRRHPEIATLYEIKISGRIRFQIQAKLVIVVGDGYVVVEVLIIIRFAIIVQVMQTRYLVAPEHVNFPINNFQPQWLKETGGKPFPLQLLERFINATNNPYITRHRAHCCGCSILEEIKTTASNP